MEENGRRVGGVHHRPPLHFPWTGGRRGIQSSSHPFPGGWVRPQPTLVRETLGRKGRSPKVMSWDSCRGRVTGLGTP